MPALTPAPKGKKLRNLALSERALHDLQAWIVRQAQHERAVGDARPELVEGRAQP
jgi:hypothetical protein